MDSNQITYDNKEKEKENNSICECCGLCFLFLIALGFIVGAIAYIVFGIMYLVQDYEIASDCIDSSLWAYVLTAIILSFSRISSKNISDDSAGSETIICMLLCLGILEASLAIWGGTELWIKSCDDLAESNLWKFGLATFILQTFCASIFLVIIPLGIGCSLVMESRNSSDNNEENSMV